MEDLFKKKNNDFSEHLKSTHSKHFKYESLSKSK